MPVLPCDHASSKSHEPLHYKEATHVFSTSRLHTLIILCTQNYFFLSYHSVLGASLISKVVAALSSWSSAGWFRRCGQKQNTFLVSIISSLWDLASIHQRRNLLSLDHPVWCILNILPSDKYK